MPNDDDTGIKTITLESGATLEVNFDNVLGQGAYGKVYSGKFRSADGSVTNDDVAIKIPIDYDASEEEELKKETEMNKKQGLLYEQCKVDGQFYMVMPNLGKPIPTQLDSNRNISDTIVKIETESKTTIFNSDDSDTSVKASTKASEKTISTSTKILGFIRTAISSLNWRITVI